MLLFFRAESARALAQTRARLIPCAKKLVPPRALTGAETSPRSHRLGARPPQGNRDPRFLLAALTPARVKPAPTSAAPALRHSPTLVWRASEALSAGPESLFGPKGPVTPALSAPESAVHDAHLKAR